jgi:peptide/nickel transport system substrate-binding protein
MASGAVSKRAYVERQGKAYGTSNGGLMCTGPFQLECWTPGRSVVLTRRDGYWNPRLRPKAGRVELRAVADQAALTNALVTGDIDGTFQTPVAAIDRLRASGAGALYQGQSPSSSWPSRGWRGRSATCASARRCRWRWTGR